MPSEFEDVKAFHKKFGLLSPDRPSHLTWKKLLERIDFMQEELNEFKAAAEDQNMNHMADALIDLDYVAKGTAVMMGLPWNELWEDVHGANMRKISGKTHRGISVDVMKPLGWVPPRTGDILFRSGYFEEDFTFPDNGLIDESKCLDDPEVKP